jgi:uncharacterized protein YutE (UPF0331/DUF86 family)
MVDPDTVRRHLSSLLDALSDLRRYAGSVERERLGADRDTQHMVLHALYIAAQSAVDLALHIGADAGLPQASTYQEAFRHLADAGWIESDLAAELAGWAGFRNVLAHHYPVIDFDRVHAALGETAPLERFADFAAGRLEEP